MIEALDERKAALYGRQAKAARTEADEDDVRWERWTYHDWTYQERKAAERRGVELRADANVLPPRDGEMGSTASFITRTVVKEMSSMAFTSQHCGMHAMCVMRVAKMN